MLELSSLFLVVGAVVTVVGVAEGICDVKAFGATGDGVSYDTSAVQHAIDFCAAAAQQNGNMAIVVFPAPGRYLTGTLYLRSCTIIHINPGATLLASPSQDHYPPLKSRWYLLLAENVSDVGITGSSDIISTRPRSSYVQDVMNDVGTTSSGSGSIDGQSPLFVQSFNSIKNVMVSWNQTGACYGDECRPRLIGFVDCDRVHLWNIQLLQPAYWCIHILRSNEVSVHHVSIMGDFYTPNNDGIDIDSSNNTSIHSCHIDTGDDGICPKTEYGPLHNLTVSRCWIRTKSCAVKLGSGSNFNFEGLRFDDIHIVESHRGLGLQLRDSGNISDVVFSNIKITTQYYDPSWWGRAEPIYVTTCPRTPSTVAGFITNVSFVNITAASENGIFLSGLDGGVLRNIRLENVEVQLQRTTNYSGGFLDYRPGCQGLVQHQNSGVFIENVIDLVLENVRVLLAPNVEMYFVPIEFSPGTAAESMYFVNFSLIFQTSLNNMKLE